MRKQSQNAMACQAQNSIFKCMLQQGQKTKPEQKNKQTKKNGQNQEKAENNKNTTAQNYWIWYGFQDFAKTKSMHP